MSAEAISLEEARRVVLEASGQLEAQDVALERALGRALAEDVVAAGDVPPYPGSAMVGFAIVAGPRDGAWRSSRSRAPGIPLKRR